MAIVGFKEFLHYERDIEYNNKLEHERIEREKEKILRRIMDSNLHIQGFSFKQARVYTKSKREKERT